LNKWLGDKIKYVSIGESKKTNRGKLGDVQYGKADVLIISYDQLRLFSNDLQKIPQIGLSLFLFWIRFTNRTTELIICDEGHRLKNAEIKTTKAVASLPAKKRVILSGTPIQNNLDEFYAMVNFVNPEVLGKILDERLFLKLNSCHIQDQLKYFARFIKLR
jgi:SNF2 family DNA or RNA helicase